MRYTSSSGLLIPVYLVVIVLSEFFVCQDICEDPGLATYENVTSENGSYKYSYHYYYSQIIRHDQPYPVVSDSFKKFSTDQNVTSKFSFKYYGSNVTSFKIFQDGKIKIFGERQIGSIYHIVYGNFFPEYDMVVNNDFIAVKWHFQTSVDDTIHIIKITNVIHSSGKISLYYDDIPTGQKKILLSSLISGVIECGKTLEDVRKPEITTPEEWIKRNTLVEIEPIKNVREPEITTPGERITSDTSVELKPTEISCSIHNSIEKCQNATTSSVKCIWYEKSNMCINSDDNDVKNTTSEITEHNNHNNTSRYLYIVIPVVVVVVAFGVICIGFAIRMYKRKKSNL